MKMSSSNLQQPSIAEYYSGKTVALTGGTGFVGHCVVEKLLRCCPDVKKIFLLMRRKRNRSLKERLERLIKLPVFNKLKLIQPRFSEKIIPIYSNLEEEQLGLDDSSIELIQNEVNIFIHSAATLRFDEPLKLAFKLNTMAIRSMLQLCKGIKNLEALVHISTAYSYCNRKMIGEEIYQTGWDFDKLNDAMQWMTDDMIEKLTPGILGDRPNTYTLTKAFGEEVLVKDGEGVPICIVRPSIIGGAEQEPLPGWCSNLNGFTGMMIAIEKGLLHIVPTPPDTNIDIIPVDYVVNGVLAAGWKTGLSRQGPKMLSKSSEDGKQSFPKVDTIAGSLRCNSKSESVKMQLRRKAIPIYQIAIGQNNLIAREWADLGNEILQSHPNDSVIQEPFVQLAPNKYVYRFQCFIHDFIPACLVDTWLVISKQKPMMLKYHRKITENIDILLHFMTNTWQWKQTNTHNLFAEMSREDKRNFNILTDDINWKQYITNYSIGSKLYITKETPQDYAIARRRRLRLKFLGYIIRSFVVMVFWRRVVAKTAIARNLWKLFLSLVYKLISFFQFSNSLKKSKNFRL